MEAAEALVAEGVFNVLNNEAGPDGACDVCRSSFADAEALVPDPVHGHRWEPGAPGSSGRLGPFALIAGDDPTLPDPEWDERMPDSAVQDAEASLASRIPWCVHQMSLRIEVGNPAALDECVRFRHSNLNRILLPARAEPQAEDPEPLAYEKTRARVLMEAIAEADAFLDLHSCSADSPPFALPLGSPPAEAIARALPVDYVIDKLGHATVVGGTSLDYAQACNDDGKARAGVTIECGQHADPRSVATARDAILTFVFGPSPAVRNHPIHLVSRESVRVGSDFEFVRQWGQFEVVDPGTVICRNNGDDIVSRADSPATIIMPARDPVPGEEAFFWGIPASLDAIHALQHTSRSSPDDG